MTSSNSSVPLTMMGSTSTLQLSGDSISTSTNLDTSLTSTGQSSDSTALVSPSTSILSGTTPSSSSSSQSNSTSDYITKSSSTGFHTHGSYLHNSTTLSSSLVSNSSLLYLTSSDSSISSSSDFSVSSSDSSSFHDHSSSSLYSSSEYSSSYHEHYHSSSSSLSSSSIYTSSTDETTSQESSVFPYAEATQEPDSITYTYTQAYLITDDSTTLATEIPVTTTVDADYSFPTDEPATITTDLAFLANAVPGYSSSTQNTTSGSSDSDGSNTSKGTVAGSVVGAIAGAAIILILVWWFIRRRKRSSYSMEKGFSHSIQSTRRYDGIDYDNQEKPLSNGNSGSRFALSSFLPFLSKSKSSSSSHSYDSTNSSSSGFGLGSLRTSILQDQPPSGSTGIEPSQQYTRVPPPRRPHTQTQQRTIDTVMEEPETPSSTEPYTNIRPQTYKTTRYQNSGLRPTSLSDNPFDDLASKRAPPPPPSRRANAYPAAVDYHRHGVNRHSVTSVESSILSDDTGDVSSDESLILNEGQRSGDNTGFFREIV